MADPFLKLEGIAKSYPGVAALEGISLSVSRGEVIVDHGTFRGKPGRGQFVKRKAGRPLVP